MFKFTKDDIDYILAILAKAGNLLREFRTNQGFGVNFKKDESPVTEADHASNALIVEALARKFPDIPIISEECSEESNLEVLAHHNTFWLLDPLDGTWSFIEGNEFFSINLALVIDGDPIYGFLEVPIPNVTYYTDHNLRCIKRCGNEERELHAKELKTSGWDVLVSHSKMGDKMQSYLSGMDVASVTPIPAAVKFGLLAEGVADIYPRFGTTCAWDTAAGHALLKSIGGDIFDLSGKVLKYNKMLKNEDFIAVRRAEFCTLL